MIRQNDVLAQVRLDTGDPHPRTVDIGVIAPIGSVEAVGCRVSLSLDGGQYTPVAADHAGDDMARYLRVERAEDGTDAAYALVRAGAGYVAYPNEYWTRCLTRRQADAPGDRWRGGDGIYTFNLSDGLDCAGNRALSRTRTLITFGDTILSGVDGDTGARTPPVSMINNSFAILDGEDPRDLRFLYAFDGAGQACGVLRPSADCFDFAAHGLSRESVYYWLQDGVIIGDTYHTLPLLITEDKSRPDGFQFRVLGVNMVSVPIADGMPAFDRARQRSAQVYAEREDGKTVLYGAGIMPYCAQAGYAQGDGFVYVYGYIDAPGQLRSLCVARVRYERFAERDAWRFFDGRDFVEDILESAPLLAHISCEMSVTPIRLGANKGKMLAVYQYDTNSAYTAYSIGDTPWGPFGAQRKVYRCEESFSRAGTYTYNAKAHPHLSGLGRLLASYNVNTTDFRAHMEDALLYRPRFIDLCDTTVGEWDALFADGYEQRVNWFRKLNENARRGGTVFVGDSLIHEFPLEEMLADFAPVYNRGIGADTTTGLRARLRESVLDLAPSKVFFLIGTNDLFFGDTRAVIEANMEAMLDDIRARLPGARPYVLSLVPINLTDHPKIDKAAVGDRGNERIRDANAGLRALCARKGVRYVDIHGALADADGNFALRYTREGLHFSPEGYEALCALLRGPLAE